MIECIPARKQDLPALAILISQIWPDEQQIQVVAEAFVSGPHRALYVLHQPLNGRIGGFVSGFGLPSALADHVWWVDQIAIAPDLRGRGLSTQLIESILDSKEVADASLAAAIVRDGNTPAEAAFRAAGFEPEAQAVELMIWPPAERMPVLKAAPEDLRILMVDTLTYQGVWIEGLNPQGQDAASLIDAVTLARALGGLTQRPMISSLIDARQVPRLPRPLRKLSTSGGRFRRWLRPLKTG